MDERDPIIERAVQTLKEPVRLSPDLNGRVMAAVERSWWGRDLLQWLRRGRTVTVSPLGGLGLVTAVAALLLIQRSMVDRAPQAGEPVAADGVEVVQFVLVAPGASEVALVGDFNDWRLAATPMHTVPGNGVWTATVRLEPGRYRYAFVVDGTTWVQDPTAPPALDNDFGRPNSVVTVRGS